MRRTSFLLASLLTLGLVACGGEDRLSREEFVEQADAICKEGNEELDRLGDELVAEGEQPTEEDLEEFIDQAVANVRGQLDEIEELSPPEDMEADVEELVDTARGELDDLEEAGPDAFTTGENPFEEANAQAAELGLEECAAD